MTQPLAGGTRDLSPDEREDVARMVDAIEPRWSVEDVRASDVGSNAVFFLTVGTQHRSREVVLKAFSREVVSPEVARSEPRMLELLADETGIPVPRVFGFVDEHPDLPAPFFVAERLPGENGSDHFADLSTDALEQVLAQAGYHLAELHGVRSFERFGRVGVEDGDLSVVGGTHEWERRWADWLLAEVDTTLDGLEGGRFDDLVPPLREHLHGAIPELDGPDTSALLHWDYRIGNLLLDTDTGRTRAVLDWAGPIAGDPVYNLVTVEDHNVNWQTQDVVLRRRLRERFLSAYDAHRSADLPADFHRRKRLYHLCHRLNAMACLPDWYADDEEVRREREAVHRAFVREYLE